MILLQDDLRRVLAQEQFSQIEIDNAIATIATMLNDISTHDAGRECLIRLLARKSSVPKHHHELIDDLLRNAGLLPYAGAPNTLEDAVLQEAHAIPNLKGDWVFHSLQLQVFRLIMNKRNVVLSATTSVGKSIIIDAVIASGRFKKIVVIVPTIALIDETRRRISKAFADTHVVVTHPTQKPDGHRPVVYILTQERVLNRDDLGDVDFFVVDEFYKLDLDRADTRAVDLNLAFHRLATSGAQFYLIGPHISEVRGLADRYQYHFIPSRFSTVALDIEHFNLPPRSELRDEKLLELVSELTSPTLIYCQSPSKCAEVAELIIDQHRLPKIDDTKIAVDWLRQEFPEEWIVIRVLERGVGIHHGNVPRALQHYMIRCFEERTIQFLICTSTIIEGVNTVAENVIVYDRRLNTSTIDSFTFRNIAGRAGRMGQWFIGKVYVLESAIVEEEKTVSLPIEQQNQDTPMSLLLDLPEADLSDGSQDRIDAAVNESSLELQTLKANRHISIDAQRFIADKIRADLTYRELLNWRGMPSGMELSATCELIYDYIDEGRSLRAYQIFNGQQLSARLSSLANSTIKEFIESRVLRRRDEDSVSAAVDTALRFIRSYVIYTFPRQLSAINSVYNDVMRKIGRAANADYSLYAAKTENLFLDSGLFALDEYGVPPQTARRIGQRHRDIDSLDGALRTIAAMDLDQQYLHPFERDLLRELNETVSLKQSVFD